MCHVTAESDWEVVNSSYYGCHVSAQSSWDIALSSYDGCHVSAYSISEVVQKAMVWVLLQLRIAGK